MASFLKALHSCTRRVDDLRGWELVPSCEHVILKPLKFEGHVTRRLSGWCIVIPAVDVGAKLETIEVCVATGHGSNLFDA